MNLAEALEAYGVLFHQSPSEPDEIKLCCPFCVDRNETPDTRFRLGINMVSGFARCFNCEWRGSGQYTFDQIQRKLEMGQMVAAAKKLKKKKKAKTRWPVGYRPLVDCKGGDYWEKKAYKYIRGRGVSRKQMRRHKIGFTDSDEKYAYRVIFPVLYKDKLKGLVTRVVKGKPKNAYKNSVGDKVLYGINRKKRSRIVLVEGVFDKLAIERAIGNVDVGAVLGHDLTDRQLRMLRRYKQIVVWFDPDKAGLEGTVSAYRSLRSEFGSHKELSVVDPRQGSKDPGDCSEEELRAAYKAKVKFTEGLFQKLRLRLTELKEDE